MHVISAGELRSVLHYRMLIERLRQGFRAGCALPPAQRYAVPTYGAHDAGLTLRPAWTTGRHIGVMVETSFPDNPQRDLPVTTGCYLLLDGKTGTALAVLDAKALITQRTAAAAALAASYLARPDSRRLLVMGTGALAAHLIEAYSVALPIRQVLVWGRDPAKAERIAARFRRGAVKVSATDDLFDLARGERSGRRFYDQITVCKAVGCALEDLIAAELAVEMVVHNETLR